MSGDTILSTIEARTLVANVRRAGRGAFESVLIAARSSSSALRTGADPPPEVGLGSLGPAMIVAEKRHCSP